MDVHFKNDVSDVQAIQLPILRAVVVVASVMHEFGKRCTITSLNDGKHSEQSFHYHGLAVDFRTREEGPDFKQWPSDERRHILQAIKNRLGSDYDCVDERDHYHVEFDPK